MSVKNKGKYRSGGGDSGTFTEGSGKSSPLYGSWIPTAEEAVSNTNNATVKKVAPTRTKKEPVEAPSMPEESAPFHPVPGAGRAKDTATDRVRTFGLQRRQDTPVNYKKHVLFAVVAAFVVQLAANPSRVRTSIFGK